MSKLQEQETYHGKLLLRLYPNATIQNPLYLTHRVVALEVALNKVAICMCNGVGDRDDLDERWEKLVNLTQELLKPEKDQLEIGGDPRGTCLKVPADYLFRSDVGITRDFGGDGMIAPELEGTETYMSHLKTARKSERAIRDLCMMVCNNPNNIEGIAECNDVKVPTLKRWVKERCYKFVTYQMKEYLPGEYNNGR